MCDILILDGSKYICHECYGELCEFKKTLDFESMTIADVRKKIVEFLNSEMGSHSPVGVGIEEEFRRLMNDKG